jgi:hypothetical protein
MENTYQLLKIFRSICLGEEKSSVDLVFQLGGLMDEECWQVEEMVEVGGVEELTSEVYRSSSLHSCMLRETPSSTGVTSSPLMQTLLWQMDSMTAGGTAGMSPWTS